MVDFATLAIVLLIMIAFCIPFIYSYQKKKQHEKKLAGQFINKARELQLDISVYDIWRRKYAIGIDKSRGQLLYVKFEPDKKVNLFKLSNIKKVRVQNEQREVGSGKEKDLVIDKIWLALAFNDPKVPEAILEFYDADESFGLIGEPLLAKKWQALVGELLENIGKPQPKRSVHHEQGVG